MNPVAPLPDFFDIPDTPYTWEDFNNDDLLDLGAAGFVLDATKVQSTQDRLKSLLEIIANKEFLSAISDRRLLPDIQLALQSGSQEAIERLLRDFADPDSGPDRIYYDPAEAEQLAAKVDAIKREIHTLLPPQPKNLDKKLIVVPIQKEPVNKPPAVPNKMAVVLRVIRGEQPNSLSQKLNLEVSVIKEWCTKAFQGMKSALEAS